MRKFAVVCLIPVFLVAWPVGRAHPRLGPSDAVAAEDCKTQLWGNVSIQSPAADVPENLKRWSGLYGDGRWDGVLCNSLAVLSVGKDGAATVQYAWGSAPQWNVRPGYQTYGAKIEGNALKFFISYNNGGGASVEYDIDATGHTLNGTYRPIGREASRIMLTKAQ